MRLRTSLTRGIEITIFVPAFVFCFLSQGFGQLQQNVVPELSIGKVQQIPAEWIALGFPKAVDFAKPRGGTDRIWIPIRAAFRERAHKKALVLPRDFEIVKLFISQLPGKDESYYEAFCQLTEYFVGTPYEKQAALLVRPFLKQENLPFSVKVLAATELKLLGDKESVPDMLVLLTQATDDVDKRLLKSAIRKLGYEIPFEDNDATPK